MGGIGVEGNVMQGNSIREDGWRGNRMGGNGVAEKDMRRKKMRRNLIPYLLLVPQIIVTLFLS